MAERGIRPDMILIGEPTSEDAARRHRQDRPARLGQHVDRRCRACRAMSPTRTAPTIRCRSSAGVIAALEALHLDDGNDSFQPSNLEITAVETASKATNVIPGCGARAAQHPLQQSPARRRPGRAGPPHRRGGGARRDGRGEDFGRGLPDPARADLRHRQRRDRGGDRRDAAPLHPWRHLGRPLPDRALPGGRFRPAQRDHAQARRGRRGRRHPRARSASTRG